MLTATSGFGRALLDMVSRRVGTFVSAFLVAQGVPEDLAHQLYLASAVVAALAFDAGIIVYQNRSAK